MSFLLCFLISAIIRFRLVAALLYRYEPTSRCGRRAVRKTVSCTTAVHPCGQELEFPRVPPAQPPV